MLENINISKVTELLGELIKALPETPIVGDLPTNRRKTLRKDVSIALGKLKNLADALDPVGLPTFVFEPSNPEFFGKLIGITLLEQLKQPLGAISKFYGSGVYALYYKGDFPAYAPIRNKETPIYVGKANPKTRKAKTLAEQGQKLCERLNKHAKSIQAATTTLKIEDFDCRYLAVQSGHQSAAEDYLLNLFMPVWNTVCDGFGKHGDSAGTRKNTRSPWDSIHPGRGWATSADNKPNPLSTKQICEQIAEHFRKHPPQ